MTDRVRFRPFTGDIERRVEMSRAPLALVLAQVRWPEHRHLAAEMGEFAQEFGKHLDHFPLSNEITEQGFHLTPEGVKPVNGVIYEWRSIDDVWVVRLGATFMSLYCAPHENYRYAEFAEHLDIVLSLLKEVLRIQVTERIGVRYVNRLSEPEVMAKLPDIFDPRVLGMEGLASGSGVRLVSTLSQAVYKVEDVNLQVRSGYLPAGETMDPAIEPIGRPSWILDLDAYQEGRLVYAPEQVREVASRLADTAYDFFKLVLKVQGEVELDGRS